MSISSMSHVKLEKMLCRPVGFKTQGHPQKAQGTTAWRIIKLLWKSVIGEYCEVLQDSLRRVTLCLVID